MSEQVCQICREKRRTDWPGAAICKQCGFICSKCASGRTTQCPICEKHGNLKKI